MITEERLKDTTLDDSAEIYQLREELTEKQKLRNMTTKDKIVYFNNYYRTKFIIIIAVIALVIYFAYSILTPSPEAVLYAAVLNNVMDEQTAVTIQHDFAKHLDINSETQEVIIDTSFILSSEDNSSQYTMGNDQKLATFIYAKEIDIMIAPESTFELYAANGSLCKLSDQLPADLYSSLADSFYYSSSIEDPNLSAYGIYLDSIGMPNNTSERTIIGIIINSEYKSNAAELIRFINNFY